MRSLADSLRTNTTLTTLLVDGNNGDADAVQALADSLRTNTTLSMLGWDRGYDTATDSTIEDCLIRNVDPKVTWTPRLHRSCGRACQRVLMTLALGIIRLRHDQGPAVGHQESERDGHDGHSLATALGTQSERKRAAAESEREGLVSIDPAVVEQLLESMTRGAWWDLRFVH